MFKGLRQLFSNSSESLDCSLSSTETIISEDEQLEDGTATYPTAKMEGNVQKTNNTEESVVGAEMTEQRSKTMTPQNWKALKFAGSTTEEA